MPSSFAIGEHFEELIDKLVASGRYNSRSEVVREGLRTIELREEERKIAIEKLKALYDQGLNSGPPIDADDVFDRLEAKYRRMAADRGE